MNDYIQDELEKLMKLEKLMEELFNAGRKTGECSGDSMKMDVFIDSSSAIKSQIKDLYIEKKDI